MPVATSAASIAKCRPAVCVWGGVRDIGGPQARVPLYVPYADFFQYQAGAGRLAGRA